MSHTFPQTERDYSAAQEFLPHMWLPNSHLEKQMSVSARQRKSG